MSLIISMYLPQGVVMSADSRVTNKDGYCSDNAHKLFVTQKHVGISTCGNRSSGSLYIEVLMDEFLDMVKDYSVTEVANAIIPFFKKKWKDMDSTFLVAGYEKQPDDSWIQKKFRILTDNKSIKECDYITGAQWSGKTSIVARIINDCYWKEDGKYLEYTSANINWSRMNIQDGIDLSRFLFETTIKAYSFMNEPHTVGGNIDILVLTPGGHQWISQKTLV